MGKSVNTPGGLTEKVRSMECEPQEGKGLPPTKQALNIFHLTLKELHFTAERVRKVQSTIPSRTLLPQHAARRGDWRARGHPHSMLYSTRLAKSNAKRCITAFQTLKLKENRLPSGPDSPASWIRRVASPSSEGGGRRKPLTSSPDTIWEGPLNMEGGSGKGRRARFVFRVSNCSSQISQVSPAARACACSPASSLSNTRSQPIFPTRQFLPLLQCDS